MTQLCFKLDIISRNLDELSWGIYMHLLVNQVYEQMSSDPLSLSKLAGDLKYCQDHVISVLISFII
jgi:hypothetical protein